MQKDFFLSTECIDSSWKDFFREESSENYFSTLDRFVADEYSSGVVYPSAQDIFNAFKQCSLDNVKVVILGQDPYHGEGQAHGLSFSVKKGQRLPPSLRNIFKELESEFGGKTEIIKGNKGAHGSNTPVSDGDLTYLAEQGVLLLNSVLTVRAGEACSHRNKGWETFTDAVIQHINIKKDAVVFILWGKYAQDKAFMIDDTRHLILKSSHPSPLSAHRGFFGNNHFKNANQYLLQHQKKVIHWL